MKNNIKISLVMVAWILSFCAGLKLGINTCKPIVNKTITTDTVIQYVTSQPLTIISKPISKIIHDTIISKIVNTKIKTDTIWKKNNSTFFAVDTLRYDSLLIAILDIGNCEGISNRKTFFSGKIKSQIITNTITNNITSPPAMLSVHGGVSSLIFNSKLLDAGPGAQLNFKNKLVVGYSYFINSKNHSISLLTKIK
jgi:hypothetical protein